MELRKYWEKVTKVQKNGRDGAPLYRLPRTSFASRYIFKDQRNLVTLNNCPIFSALVFS